MYTSKRRQNVSLTGCGPAGGYLPEDPRSLRQLSRARRRIAAKRYSKVRVKRNYKVSTTMSRGRAVQRSRARSYEMPGRFSKTYTRSRRH